MEDREGLGCCGCIVIFVLLILIAIPYRLWELWKLGRREAAIKELLIMLTVIFLIIAVILIRRHRENKRFAKLPTCIDRGQRYVFVVAFHLFNDRIIQVEVFADVVGVTDREVLAPLRESRGYRFYVDGSLVTLPDDQIMGTTIGYIDRLA